MVKKLLADPALSRRWLPRRNPKARSRPKRFLSFNYLWPKRILNPNRSSSAARPLSKPTEFEALLNKEFKPKTDQCQNAVQEAVRTLAAAGSRRRVTDSDDVLVTIQSLIAELDRKLAEQVNLIIHHEDFKKLEGTWRGLHHLVNNTETDEKLKIRVMNISKKELGGTLKKYKGTAWDQSPLFKKIYEEEYGIARAAQPYGCLIGDY